MRYLIRVLKDCRLKEFKEAVQQVRERSGRGRLLVTADMVFSALRYGAGYRDYVTLGFDRMKRKNRRTYLTRIENRRLIQLVNDRKYRAVFEDKAKFCACFSDMLGRDYLLMEDAAEEEIAAFLQQHPVVFAKAREGGRDMERLVVQEFENLHSLVHYVMNPLKRFTVLEEAVQQHPALNALYPESVNCLRLLTVLDEQGEPHCLYGVLKMGNAGRWTDSRCKDRLVCLVDLKTGRLKEAAYTENMERLTEHPYTGKRLQDYQLPFVQEAVALAMRAAKVIPQVRYMGWNIALTQKGPVLMEGVCYPEYLYGQLPEYTPDQVGLLPSIQKYVKGM